jgi:hypothetical protein
MLRIQYHRVTLPGTQASPDRTAFVFREAVLAIEELHPGGGEANALLHLANGSLLAVRETAEQLFAGDAWFSSNDT